MPEDGNEFFNHIEWLTGDEAWFHLWMLKPQSSQSSQCTHIHQTSWKSYRNIVCQKINGWQLFSGTWKGFWWWNSCNKGP
jgi:hypothetical protein